MYSWSMVFQSAITAVLIGPGALVSPDSTTSGVGLLVSGGADITVDGISFAGDTSLSDSKGVRCTGPAKLVLRNSTITDQNQFGVRADDCDIAISSSTLSENTFALVLRTSSFSITNNFFLLNGSSHDGGGVQIADPATERSRLFQFNTLVANLAPAQALAAAIECSVGGTLTLANNIIKFNVGRAPVYLGGCDIAYSDIQGDSPGVGNIDIDPQFADISANDFHLQSGSPCVDAADPNAAVSTDFDGDPRPPGRADMGADEVVP